MCFRPAELKMNTCSECGKVNKPIAKVCEACGAELQVEQNITCPICGLQNPATATVCAQCGATEAEIMAAMNKPSATPKSPVAPSAPQPPKAPSAPQSPEAPSAPQSPEAPKPPT